MTAAPTGTDSVGTRAEPPAHTPAHPLAGTLAAICGADHVLIDPSVTASYETDWTRRFTGRAALVVRPATTGEVSAVLAACRDAGAAVVVQGGNTGLVGGGVPSGGEVVLSTRRLATLAPVDVAGGHVLVGAGVTLAALQAHVRPLGWDVGVDFAARESVTVGGLVATNAGGENVLRHGPMRAQVLGLEAVLADGSVLSRLSALPKDNTGYDLTGLLAGSEGTLAVLTRVLVRLVPRRAARAVAVLGCESVAAVQAALRHLSGRLPDLESAELFLADGLALVRAHTGLGPVMAQEHPAYLLVEVAATQDPTTALYDALAGLSEDGDGPGSGVADIVVAQDAPAREKLWRYREAHTESVSAAGIPVKLDVAVPAHDLDAALPALQAAAQRIVPRARVYVWGHVNEGNLHVNVLPPGAPGAAAFDDDTAEEVTDAVLREVAARGGSISAEHGVGRAKTRWLPLTRSATEIATMRGLKAAFDPTGMLNPGVMLPVAAGGAAAPGPT